MKVLADLSQLKIHESIDQIKEMSVQKYNLILHVKIGKLAFQWLLDKTNFRQSENAKGKYLTYTEFKIADYLSSSDTDIYLSKRKSGFFNAD